MTAIPLEYKTIGQPALTNMNNHVFPPLFLLFFLSFELPIFPLRYFSPFFLIFPRKIFLSSYFSRLSEIHKTSIFPTKGIITTLSYNYVLKILSIIEYCLNREPVFHNLWHKYITYRDSASPWDQ